MPSYQLSELNTYGRRVSTIPAQAERRRPKILFFAPKVCWPLDTGAKLRNYYLASGLGQDAELTYLSFNDDKSQIERLSDSGESYQISTDPLCMQARDADRILRRSVVIDRSSKYSTSNIIRGAIGSTPLTALNYTSPDMATQLLRLLRENNYDIVQMESVHLAGYLPLIRSVKSRPMVICDWHNVESELMSRYSRYESRLARRLYAKMTARRLRSFEQHLIPQFDAHLAVSFRDAKRITEFTTPDRVFVLENGVDAGHYSDASLESAHLQWVNCEQGISHFSSNNVGRNRLLFVGSMDYHANEDAVLYFAREIWPAIHNAQPDLVFTIVGRNPTASVTALRGHPGIEVTGTVEDVRPYYFEAVAAVVPLRIGGGSRLKILEAMAAGVPVISTSLGAEGLAVEDRKNILFADGREQFTKAILEISVRRVEWDGLATEARRLVSESYGWSSISARLKQIYDEMLSKRWLASYQPASTASQPLTVGSAVGAPVPAAADCLG